MGVYKQRIGVMGGQKVVTVSDIDGSAHLQTHYCYFCNVATFCEWLCGGCAETSLPDWVWIMLDPLPGRTSPDDPVPDTLWDYMTLRQQVSQVQLKHKDGV